MTGRGVETRKTSNAEGPTRISYVDEAILNALWDFHYLTADQLCRLLYSPGSLNYAREQLKRLYDAQFLDRVFGPRAQAAGSTPWVYLLGKRGLRYFKDRDTGATRRYRPSEERQHSDPFLFHTLSINEVLIMARRLAATVDAIDLVGMRHDLDLKHTPARVETERSNPTTGERELTAVVPDGWMHFRVAVPNQDKPASLPLVLELDRDTKSVQDFKRKIRGLLAYVRGPYEHIFGVKAATVAFVVDTAGQNAEERKQRRVRDLLRWTEEELTDLHKTTWGSAFVFTALPARDALDPRRLFLHPSARAPFSKEPLSLLDLPSSVPIEWTDGVSKPLPAQRQQI